MKHVPRDRVVITAALVGAEVTRAQTPFLPLSPEEIAEEARRAVDAGAAVVHIHAREEDGTPSQRPELFRAIVDAIRARTDAIIQVSTGGAVGMSPEERLGGLEASVEMATLNCGSVNFGDGVFENPMPVVRQMARAIHAAGAVPELEIYEVGHWDSACLLHREGLLPGRYHVQFVLGVRGAAGARPSVLRFLVGELPYDAHWAAAGVGRHQFPIAAFALDLGGHVRVGLEDNIYLSKGVLAEGNGPLVERAAALARERGREPMSAAELRSVMGQVRGLSASFRGR